MKNKTENTPINYDALLATVDNKTYKLTEEEIKSGDLIYNEFAKQIDKCIKTFNDNTMCVEFKSGNRAMLSVKHYKRAIPQ